MDEKLNQNSPQNSATKNVENLNELPIEAGTSPQGESAESYNASKIKVLGGTEAVRQTPAMYIGDTGSYGLHHLVYEIVDNSVDEALAGFCTHIVVKVHPDDSISVLDNGRGIPVDYHEKEKKSTLEVITTVLHSGGKFDRKSYKVSGGLHGVGISVVNALSEKMEIEVFRDGDVYCQRYERGKPVSAVEKIGKTSKRGTKVWFKPDPLIFEERIYSYAILSKRLRELSFLNNGIHITLIDERDSKSEVFYNEEGIKAFVRHLNESRSVLHEDVIYFGKTISDKSEGDVIIELALQYHDGYNETLYSYANNIHTREGGTHLSGFRSGLTRTMNSYAKKEALLKEKDKFVPVGEDWREGLTAVLCVKLPKPQFEGQTKAKLGNRDIQGIVETAVNDQLAIYLEEHPQIAKIIVNKGLNAAHVREATRKVRDLERQRKSPLHSGGLPGKLADCISSEVESTELYLVEGDSAGGSAKSGRDRRFQAILPLKGKILNVEKARLDKILAHNEIKMIVTALGAGIQNEFDITKRRYGKIIIMTDADVDGSHIRTLLLTFFFRNMRSLLEEGCVYIAQPPLYKFKRKKKEQYLFSDQEFQATLLEFGAQDTKLRLKATNQVVEGEELTNLLRSLSNLQVHLHTLAKHHIDPIKFLRLRDEKTRLFPRFEYSYREEKGYFFQQEEVNKFMQQRTTIGEEVFIQEEAEKIVSVMPTIPVDAKKAKNALYLKEIYAAEEIHKAVCGIENAGIKLEEYFTPHPAGYELTEEKESLSVKSLVNLVEEVKNIAKKGLEVQRYKGLGEMNPDQLWTTTMNPETRTLFRVRLEDASEAERLFSILMGNNVDPRKNFIDKHALDVRNLDV